MIGMLVGDELEQEGGSLRILLRPVPWQFMQMIDETDLAFDPELDHRRKCRRIVEGAGGNRHSIRRFIGERRAAVAAKAALDKVGRAEFFRSPRVHSKSVPRTETSGA